MTYVPDHEDLPTDGSVVIGEAVPQPEPRRPRALPLVAILVALLAGSLVFGLGESGFMTSDEVIAERTPGLATVAEFFRALSDGDAAAAEGLIDPEFAVLQLPDPLGWDFSFQVTFDDRFRPFQSAEEISRHLSVLVALQPDASIGNCASEVPRTPRGQELYDHFVTCQVHWQDELRENLDAPAVILTIEVGVRDNLIRGFFLEAPEDLVEPGPATVDPVTGMFLSWLAEQHPAAAADAFLRTRWGDTRGLRGPDAANQLLGFSAEFGIWQEAFETTGTVPPPSMPTGRVGHALVYRSSPSQVLLVGGRAGSATNDVWSFEAGPGAWGSAGTIDLSEGTAITAAVRHPTTDQILAVAQNVFTLEVGVWSLTRESAAWLSIAPPPRGEEWCFDPPGLLPDPSSRSFLVVLCSGTWVFDPGNDSWIPGSGRAFYDLVSPLLSTTLYNNFDGGFATTLTPDLLVGAGAGQIRSAELPSGPVTVLETDGPVEVSAIAFDSRAGVLIIIGDGALWSFDLEDQTLSREMTVPVAGVSADGMYWRSAAAAYDEAADTVVIFDGERTWTFNVDSGELRPVGVTDRPSAD